MFLTANSQNVKLQCLAELEMLNSELEPPKMYTYVVKCRPENTAEALCPGPWHKLSFHILDCEAYSTAHLKTFCPFLNILRSGMKCNAFCWCDALRTVTDSGNLFLCMCACVCFQTAEIGMTENVGDSGLRFEIWFRRRKSQDTFILQASSGEVKAAWTSIIGKILWRQALRNRGEVHLLFSVKHCYLGNTSFFDCKSFRSIWNASSGGYITPFIYQLIF